MRFHARPRRSPRPLALKRYRLVRELRTSENEKGAPKPETPFSNQLLKNVELEHKFRGQLNQSRTLGAWTIIDKWPEAPDLTKGCGGHIAVWICKISVVEDVVDFHAHLESLALGNSRILLNREVRPPVPWATQQAARCISESADRIICERGCIKPLMG